MRSGTRHLGTAGVLTGYERLGTDVFCPYFVVAACAKIECFDDDSGVGLVWFVSDSRVSTRAPFLFVDDFAC